MRLSSDGFSPQSHEGEKVLNSELWHACAGPLVSLPATGNRVVYFAQGHSEQVTASTNKEMDAHIPSYPSLPPQLICQLHNVTMHADVETDEVYAQMTLQPLSQQEQKESYLPAELGAPSKQPTNYFCKTLTASDTSTHGGFSVPRRAAEKVFPPLDFSQQPPAQELMARDLHDNEWKFRHIFRGQPKRHLLTTGWSVFVSAKRLVAGDSVIFIWNEKNQLLLGIRRANRPQTIMPSSVLSCDSMHLGLLAAAAHAAATNSRFTIFYNPRASPTEFVIPFAKYVKAVYNTRVSVGMRFRMMFETEESSVRRYMGTITGISDSDPRWPKSHWRSVKVGWDESSAGERQPRVSLWEIEPLTTFPMYPPPFSLRLKRPWPTGLPSFNGIKENDLGMNSTHLWLGGDNESLNFNGAVSPWMQPRLDSSMLGLQSDAYHQSMALEKMKMISPSKSPFQFQYSPQAHPPFLPNTSENGPHQAFLPPMVENGPNSRPQIQTPPRIFQQNLQIPNERSTSDSYHSLLSSFPPNEDDSSHLLNLQRNNCPIPSSTWPSKRAALDPLFPFLLPQVEEEHSVSLPPFPGRECLINQQNTLLYGLNIEPKNTPFCSNFMALNGSDYPDNGVITPSTSIDDPKFLSAQNMPREVNPSSRNFVKVYKRGSFGRSLDVTKFNSYHALCSELEQMFSLNGVLEDPLRSGWQLVFVDQENEILLLGDDPWPEFINKVWCIKIMSPQEVLEMGKDGTKLLNTSSIQRLSGGSCDLNLIGQNLRNASSVITSGGSIDD